MNVFIGSIYVGNAPFYLSKSIFLQNQINHVLHINDGFSGLCLYFDYKLGADYGKCKGHGAFHYSIFKKIINVQVLLFSDFENCVTRKNIGTFLASKCFF